MKQPDPIRCACGRTYDLTAFVALSAPQSGRDRVSYPEDPNGPEGPEPAFDAVSRNCECGSTFSLAVDPDAVLVIAKSHAEAPRALYAGKTLQAMRELVGGGYLEAVPAARNVALFCDEEGKLKRLSPNLRIPGDIVCGPVFIGANDSHGEPCDLTAKQARDALCFLRVNAIAYD